MRKILLFLLAIIASFSSNIFAQTITPSQTSEQCPGVNITFTVTIAAQNIQSVQPKALNVNPSVIQQPFNSSSNGGNITFSFIGRFADYNNKQTFTVNYTNASNQAVNYDFTFIKIKSLLTSNSFSQIFPAPASITAQRCQVQNFNISFPNVQYGNPFEAPAIGYGSVTNYEYLLPAGWSLNGTTSTGSNWIAGGNNVTVTSDLSTGDGGVIRIRPVNTACASGLVAGQEAYVSISRPAPSLAISAPQDYICTTGGTANFTLNNIPSGATVSWAITTNASQAQISGCSTCPTVTVQRTGTSNVIATLTATVTHCTFTYTRTQNITLGTGTNSVNFTSKTIFCYIGKPYFNGAVQLHPSATNYEWYSKDMSNPNNPFILRQSENSNTADFPLGNNKGNRYFTIRVIAYNSCGNIISIDEDGLIWAPSCSGGGSLRIIASPNPVTNNTTIQVVNEHGQISTDRNENIYELQVVDKLGIVHKEYKYSNGIKQSNINISNLRPDIYILRVFDGTQWTSMQIVKN